MRRIKIYRFASLEVAGKFCELVVAEMRFTRIATKMKELGSRPDRTGERSFLE
jgi:hypothetical protein